MIQKYCYVYEQNTTYSFTQYYSLKLPLCVCICVCTYVQKIEVDIGCLPHLLAPCFVRQNLFMNLELTVSYSCVLLPSLYAQHFYSGAGISLRSSCLQQQAFYSLSYLSLQLLFVRPLKSTDVEMLCVSLFNQSVTNHCS